MGLAPRVPQPAIAARLPFFGAGAAARNAVRAIPIDALQEPIRSRVKSIVLKPSIYRRMPVQVIPCDPELYVFLVRYPEVVVNMWQLMGVTKVQVKRTGKYALDATDGMGTSSRVELVYGTRDKHVLLAEGYYDGPLVRRRVNGRCVLLLSSVYSKDGNQRNYVSHHLDVFVQLDNVGLELIAKTLHPILGRTADSNFAESSGFIGQVSRVAEKNGPGVQRLASRLNNIDPAVREQFARLAAAVSHKAALRSAIKSGGQTLSLSDKTDDNSVSRMVEANSAIQSTIK
jgi:hypothetical protein